MADNVHVAPHTNGWAVTRENRTRASFVYKAQDEAIDAARILVLTDGGGDRYMPPRRP